MRASTVSPLKAIVKIMFYNLLWQNIVKYSAFREIMLPGRFKSGDAFLKNLFLITIYHKHVAKSLKVGVKFSHCIL